MSRDHLDAKYVHTNNHHQQQQQQQERYIPRHNYLWSHALKGRPFPAAQDAFTRPQLRVLWAHTLYFHTRSFYNMYNVMI